MAQQPVAVGIQANQGSFMYYTQEWYVSSLDHTVLVVGYGEEDGKPYWLVKNTYWGEK